MEKLSYLGAAADLFRRLRSSDSARSRPSAELTEALEETASGERSVEELHCFLLREDIRELLDGPMRVRPFPAAPADRWLRCVIEGAKHTDELDRKAIGRSRDAYMRWYALVRQDALDLLRAIAGAAEHGWRGDLERLESRLDVFVAGYRQRDEIGWWPDHYAVKSDMEPSLNLLQVLERSLLEMRGPGHEDDPRRNDPEAL